MKMLWKGINGLITLPNNLNTIAHLTDMSSSHIKDPVEIAKQFNTFLLVLQIILQRMSQEFQGLPYFFLFS